MTHRAGRALSGVRRPVVLLVAAEPDVSGLRPALKAQGYSVAVATAKEAIEQVGARPPDVLLLDTALPNSYWIQLIRTACARCPVAIIVVSADDSPESKVLTLDAGADDYITKPFSLPELLARVRVALRHQRRSAPGPDEAVLRVGDLRVDLAQHSVSVGDREVALTPKEFAFLALLARWPGRVLTHRVILQHVWGMSYRSETQYLRVYARQLRKKLHDDPENPRLVTEAGVGYRLVVKGAKPTRSQLGEEQTASLRQCT